MIEIVPMMPWYPGPNGTQVQRDCGQDEVYVTEDAMGVDGKPTRVRRRVGYSLRKPGAKFVDITLGNLSPSIEREIKLKLAERDAYLCKCSNDPRTDVLDWYEERTAKAGGIQNASDA